MADNVPRPTVRQLVEELKEVVDWYMLGIHLDVPVRKLREIEADTGTMQKKKADMFDQWLSRHTSASWKDVIGALERMEHIALVARLREKYSPIQASPRAEVAGSSGANGVTTPVEDKVDAKTLLEKARKKLKAAADDLIVHSPWKMCLVIVLLSVFACVYVQPWRILPFGTESAILLSVIPESKNVSEGELVVFTCATPNSGITLTWNIILNVTDAILEVTDLSSGGRKILLSFTAKAHHNGTVVSCVANNSISETQSSAVLLVQGFLSPVGYLTSIEVDHCTLNFTWTAPYTLQGVPIHFYEITIISLSPFNRVLGFYSVRTTEFLYSVSSLGETLKVLVAAVNDVGTCAHASTIVHTPSSVSSVKFPLDDYEVVRDGNTWNYTFHIKRGFICTSAVRRVSLTAGIYNSWPGNMSSDGEVIVVRITRSYPFMERKYLASMLVEYNGGVNQFSKPVIISTFDVQNVTVTSVTNGSMCLTVDYIKGHKTSPRCFVKLTCVQSSFELSAIINGTSGCIYNVPPQNYSLLAIEADAVFSSREAAVTIVGIVVPIGTPGEATPPGPPSIVLGALLSIIIILYIILQLWGRQFFTLLQEYMNMYLIMHIMLGPGREDKDDSTNTQFGFSNNY